MNTKPPSRINGKSNPEYAKWYRQTYPEKHKACNKHAYARTRDRLRDNNEVCLADEVICIYCQQIFKRSALDKYKFLHKSRCMCFECINTNSDIAYKSKPFTYKSSMPTTKPTSHRKGSMHKATWKILSTTLTSHIKGATIRKKLDRTYHTFIPPDICYVTTTLTAAKQLIVDHYAKHNGM